MRYGVVIKLPRRLKKQEKHRDVIGDQSDKRASKLASWPSSHGADSFTNGRQLENSELLFSWVLVFTESWTGCVLGCFRTLFQRNKKRNPPTKH